MAKPKRWLRRILWSLLFLALGAAVAVWLARDLPRRKVEAVLAERLGAEVRLGALEILGTRSFVLHDLEVRRMASEPRLQRLSVARLRVGASVPEILEGRFESLIFAGVRLDLGTPDRPAVEVEPAEVRAGRLEIHDGLLTIEGGGERACFRVAAALNGVGEDVEGSVRLDSERLSFAPLIEFGRSAPVPTRRANAARTVASSEVEGLELTALIREGGRRLEIDARSSGSSLVRDGRAIALPGPSLEASAVRDEQHGTIEIEARPGFPGVGSATLHAVLDAGTNAILSGLADLRGLDVGTLLEFFGMLPDGWILEGRTDLVVEGRGPERLAYRLNGVFDRVRMPLARGPLRGVGIAITGGGELQWPVDATRPRTLAYDLRVSSSSLRAPIGRDEFLANGLSAGLRGRLDLRDPRLAGETEVSLLVPRLETAGDLVLPDALFPLRAMLAGALSLGKKPRFEGRATATSPALGQFEAGGAALLRDGAIEGTSSWHWRAVDLEPLIDVVREIVGGDPGPMRVHGLPSARGTLRGSLAGPAVEGELSLSQLEASGELPGESGRKWSFSGGSARLRFRRSADGDGIEIDPLTTGGQLGIDRLRPVPVKLTATGRVDPAPRTARLRRMTIGVEDLAEITLDGRWSETTPEVWEGNLALDGIRLDRWQTWLRPWIGDPLPGYALNGNLRARFRGSGEADGGWSAVGEGALEGGGFSSDDGTRVMQGPDGSWELTARGAGEGGPIRGRATLDLGGLLLLWGTVFGDYSELGSRIGVEAEATRSPEAGWSWNLDLATTFSEGPRIVAGLLSESGGPLAFSLSLAVDDLGSAFERYLRGPLGESVAALERIAVGGSVTAEVRGILDDESPAVEGELRLVDLGVRGIEGETRVDGLDLVLPASLVWERPDAGGARVPSGDPRTGTLRFDRLALGGIEFPATNTNLAVRADSIGIEEALAVSLLGGIVHFERLTLADLLRPSWHLESTVRLDGLSLRELTESMDTIPLEGKLDGHFPRVLVTDTTLQVDGGGEIAMFGGTVSVGDISGENLLTRFPKLKLSASLREIDLSQLTRTFDFGEMKGILQGEIRDCELFRGVPVRFEAEFETVERKGVPRKINVKAINNIAILGTGGKVTAFDRGIHKFFDTYTYEKLGLRMKLDNDVFLLRGTERRGDRELFLKGRLPFRIDVVNVVPGHTVSFQTMLRRLQNLEFMTGNPPQSPGSSR